MHIYVEISSVIFRYFVQGKKYLSNVCHFSIKTCSDQAGRKSKISAVAYSPKTHQKLLFKCHLNLSHKSRKILDHFYRPYRLRYE